MKIKMKEKHLCFIVSHLSGFPLDLSFALVSQIRDLIKGGGVAPDDMVEVETTTQELLSVYTAMAQKPEGLVVTINAEMKEELLPQLMAKLSTDEAAEAQQVLQTIQQRQAMLTAQVEQDIEKGRAIIMS